jgi:hypothetical protein
MSAAQPAREEFRHVKSLVPQFTDEPQTLFKRCPDTLRESPRLVDLLLSSKGILCSKAPRS